jgi:hypothetical protein
LIDDLFLKSFPVISGVHDQHCCPVGQLSRGDRAFPLLIYSMLDELLLDLDTRFSVEKTRGEPMFLGQKSNSQHPVQTVTKIVKRNLKAGVLN